MEIFLNNPIIFRYNSPSVWSLCVVLLGVLASAAAKSKVTVTLWDYYNGLNGQFVGQKYSDIKKRLCRHRPPIHIVDWLSRRQWTVSQISTIQAFFVVDGHGWMSVGSPLPFSVLMLSLMWVFQWGFSTKSKYNFSKILNIPTLWTSLYHFMVEVLWQIVVVPSI